MTISCVRRGWSRNAGEATAAVGRRYKTGRGAGRPQSVRDLRCVCPVFLQAFSMATMLRVSDMSTA